MSQKSRSLMHSNSESHINSEDVHITNESAQIQSSMDSKNDNNNTGHNELQYKSKRGEGI